MGDIGYIFSGLGAQWVGLGLDLLESNPKYRKAFRDFDAAMGALSGWSLEEGLRNQDRDLSEAMFWHPAIVAAEWALYKTLFDIFPPPDVVIGHSGGEVMAALAGEVLTLEGAAFLIFRQMELMAKIPPGRLLHLAMDYPALEPLVDEYGLILTGYNSPSSFVVTGEPDKLDKLLNREDLKALIRPVMADHPFHSRLLVPYLDDYERGLASLKPSPSKFTFISAEEGRVLPGESLGPKYWRNHVSQSVRFDKAMALALELGLGAVLDFSPHPILLPAVSETAASKNSRVLALPLSRRDLLAPLLWAEALKALEERDNGAKRERGAPSPMAISPKADLEGARAGRQTGLVPAGDLAQREAYELFKASLGNLGKSEAPAHFEKLILDQVRSLIHGEMGEGQEELTNGLDEVRDPLCGVSDPGGMPFMSLGLSSMDLIGLMAKLSKIMGLSLSGSLVFSYPEARSLGAYLSGRFFGSGGKGSPGA
jgi:acyl transferase domain-containing protein